MATILNRTQTFPTNGTVTAAGLHNLIDDTGIYAGLITTQTELTTVGTADQLLIAVGGVSDTGAPRRATVQNLFDDALSVGTYTGLNLSGALTYGTATGNRTISTSATITTGTIPNLTSSTASITLGTIPTLTAGTTTSTAANITNGTVQTLTASTATITSGTYSGLINSSTGTYSGAINSTLGTIATLNSTTGTIGNLSTTLAGDFTISQGTGTLGTTGVVAGTYGTSTIIPIISVDAKGRITTLSTAALGSTGKVAQVVSTTVSTSGFTSTSTSFVDVTGLSVSITPTNASSKILIFYTVFGSCNNHSAIRLLRDSTAINVGTAAGNRIATSGASFGLGGSVGASGDDAVTISGNFLDSPATTSSVTYKIQSISYLGTTWYLNTSISDGDNVYTYRGASTITAMEILP